MSQPTSTQLRSCDIVMKGGITSGVVFPQAIFTLARRFRFKNIGGTSAGSIAAAAAAAAEYRRRETNDISGFRALEKLPADLAEKTGDGSHSRLFNLFQPNARTRRVFTVITSMLGGSVSPSGLALNVMKTYERYAVVGALAGIALFVIAGLQLAGGVSGLAGFGSVLIALIALFVGVVGATIGAVTALAFDFIRELPKNNFGLCSGMPDSPDSASGKPEPLTVWLCSYLDKVAGLNRPEQPLTFGDLWGHTESDPNVCARDINLEMMTTCLTHGRPYRLPFRSDEDLKESHQFYFREDEFRKLFPKHVVDWMIENPRASSDDGDEDECDALTKLGYHTMPDPANLPIIVATRMSLSFPVLLSAIPLYAIDRSMFGGKALPEQCWFSDGGMCSNLPLHFFDSPLPRRPTFSIDLRDVPNGTPDESLSPRMPNRNNAAIRPSWNRFASEIPRAIDQPAQPKSDGAAVGGFIYSMIQAMQNWNDSTLGKLPGYRDRIVSVPLTPEEGGLNLDMPEHLIIELSKRGGLAAEELMKHFEPKNPEAHDTMTWDNHRWIRLRSMLAALERMVEQTLVTCEGPENDDQSYEAYLKAMLEDSSKPTKGPSYKMDDNRIQAALDTIAHLRKLRELWGKAGGADDNAPRPRPVLRPRPQI